jgi:hypothetical protein
MDPTHPKKPEKARNQNLGLNVVLSTIHPARLHRRPRTLNMGDDANWLRAFWLHGSSSLAHEHDGTLNSLINPPCGYRDRLRAVLPGMAPYGI